MLNENTTIKPGLSNTNAMMDRLFLRLKTLFANKKIIGVSGVVIVFVIFMGLNIVFTTNKKPSPSPIVINSSKQELLRRLNHIETRMDSLAESQNKGFIPSTQELQTISQQLNQMQQEINALHFKNNAPQIIDAVNQSNQTFTKAFTSLQAELQSLQAQVQSTHYLPITALPFAVVGIDIWNGVPKVTLKIAGETELMQPQDTRSGWTLAAINFPASEAIFVNAHQDTVKVRLKI